MLRLRHSGLLLRDGCAYTVADRVWRVLPVIAVLLGLKVLAVVGQAGVQYTMYSQFNGASKDYDGLGHNASDNNTLRVFTWFAY